MTQLTDNIWAVEVPDDAQDFLIKPHYVRNSIDERDAGKLVWFDNRGAGDWKVLPHPYFEFLFTTKGATEDDMYKIVEHEGDGFKDYDKDRFHHDLPFFSVKDSFDSLLTSKGCNTEKNHAILKLNDNAKENTD